MWALKNTEFFGKFQHNYLIIWIFFFYSFICRFFLYHFLSDDSLSFDRIVRHKKWSLFVLFVSSIRPLIFTNVPTLRLQISVNHTRANEKNVKCINRESAENPLGNLNAFSMTSKSTHKKIEKWKLRQNFNVWQTFENPSSASTIR